MLIVLLVLCTKLSTSQVTDSLFLGSFLKDTTQINKPDSIIFYNWNDLNNTWDIEWKEDITYNENELKQAETNYILKNGQWEASHKTEFYYTARLLDRREFSWWDDYEMEWVLKDKLSYKYDTNEHIIQLLDSKWSGLQKIWVNDSLSVFNYNNNQLITSSYVSFWSTYTNDWEYLTETSYGYFSGNNLRKLTSIWDYSYLSWIPQQLDTLVYGDNHELLEQKHMIINSAHTSWLNDWKKTFLYYGNGLIQDEEFLDWDEIRQEWVEISKISYHYDANWNLTLKTVFYFDWDLLVWNYQYQTINEFSTTNKIMGTTYSYWNYGKWNPLYHYAYFYPDYIGIDTEELTYSLQVYPNPAKEVLYIQFQNNTKSITFLNLYDATGRMVYKQSLNNLNSEYKIPLPNLKSGLYFLVLEADKEIITRKISIVN
ncbi:MAG: T9SS type A sorting domain-containing protein [Salinivirgaceae bacterium]